MLTSASRPGHRAAGPGLIIAALIVVLGILFVLSFDWTGTFNRAGRNADNSAPATSDPIGSGNPGSGSTPPAAEAPTPPANGTSAYHDAVAGLDWNTDPHQLKSSACGGFHVFKRAWPGTIICWPNVSFELLQAQDRNMDSAPAAIRTWNMTVVFTTDEARAGRGRARRSPYFLMVGLLGFIFAVSMMLVIFAS